MPLNTQPNFSEPGVHQRWVYTPGDAFYDALIAATVLHAGATLMTRDQRARITYDRVRVPYDFLD